MAKKADSSMYGIDNQDCAADNADRSLNSDLVVQTDSIGWTLSDHGLGDHVLPENGAQTRGVSGSAKGGHTHKGEVCGGNDEVTNEHAAHERRTLRDDTPTHAEESVHGHE